MKYLMIALTFAILSMVSAASADSANAADSSKTMVAKDPGKMRAMTDHATPMPGLMRVFTTHNEELGLGEEKSAAIEQVRGIYQHKARALVEEIIAGEKAIYQAAMDNKPLEEVNNMAQGVMEKRLTLVNHKGLLRDDMRKALSDDEWEKLLDIYKANYE